MDCRIASVSRGSEPRRAAVLAGALWSAVLWGGALLTLGGCGGPPPDLAPIERAEDLRRDEGGILTQAWARGGQEERLRALRAMGRIQDPAFAAPLAAAAERGEMAHRRAALFALGQLGLVQAGTPPPAAVAAVEEVLAQGALELRPLALEALGKLAAPGAAELLVAHLADPDPAARAAAVMALFRLRYVPQWRGDAAEPPALPAAATAGLIERLGDQDSEVRWRAAYAFSRFGEPAAASVLVPLLADEHPWARLFAARALGRSGGEAEPSDALERAVAALATALADREAAVRIEAVGALARLGATDGALTRNGPSLAEDGSFHVRAALATAFAAGAEPLQIELLRRLIGDPSPLARQAAITSLAARLGTAWAGELERYAGGDDWVGAVAAVAAARALAAGGTPEAGRAAIERALGHPDTRVRAPAVAALSELPGSAERIARALAEEDLAIRASAVDALTRIDHPDKRRWLRLAYESSSGDDWIEVREAWVAAVAADQDEEATVYLRRAATDDDASSVRAAAAAALEARGEAVPETTAVPRSEPSPFLGRRFEGNPRVVLETEHGEIEIECLAAEAPIHVANFIDLVEKGFYDGLLFHRVVSNFVIQGGDPRGDGWGGPGYTVRDEINPVRYRRGTVGMPKAGKDTGGGQLFITHIPTPHLDGNYTVFGQVVRGLEVVDAIDLGTRIVRARRME